MPLFDTVLQEKPALVFELGNAYAKLGLAGESCPRFIIPTAVRNSATGKQKRLFDYKTDQELYDQVVEFVQKLFFKYVLVSPKDRKVVIVESVLCPTIVRETLAKVLFCHFEVPSVFFVPAHLVVLATLSQETALVVDIGYKEAVIIPVYSGVQVLNVWQAQPLAAEAVHDEIKGQLLLNGVKEELLTESIVEDIKVRCCFVTSFQRATKLRNKEAVTPVPEVEYPIKGKEMITISGALRESAFEALFPQDNDRLGLPYIILDAILKCPMDMRKVLAENIFLIGGTTMMMGLTARLKDELMWLLQNDEIYKEKLHIQTLKFHTAPAKPNFTAWLGGSIYGGTELVISKSLTREVYAKNPHVPDWTTYSEEFRMHG